MTLRAVVLSPGEIPGATPRLIGLMLTPSELERYHRHLILPGIGREGQEKLRSARVVVIGAGGLGSPASLYLVAAGVGTLGIVDFDRVDASNLQRQIVHSDDDVGRPKSESARDRLVALNPHVDVVTHDTRLTSANALTILANYDIIVDGSDNFATRYLVNDAAVLLGRLLVYGSIFRFEGQVSVFAHRDGPCYRCLFPEPPPPELVPNCAEAGVFGVLPGVIGAMQATEAIKLVTGIGEPLVGRILLYDALAMSVREVRLKRNEGCVVCGENPSIRELVDYDALCGVPAKENAPMSDREITPRELQEKMERGDAPMIIDVREPHEHEASSIPGAVLMPLGTLKDHLGDIPRDREIVVHCRSGARSARAASILRSEGYDDVKNLTGGILRWMEETGVAQRR